MAFPSSAYVYEFLYRGQPPGSAAPPAWHVILAVPDTDGLGNPTTTYSPAMTPDQAVAQGMTLPSLITGINTAVAGQVTALQAQVTTLQAQVAGAPAPSPAGTLDFLAFMALFTAAEQTAIVNATDPKIKLFCLMASGAGEVQLGNAEVVTGINYLETAGILTAGRAAQVLAGTAAPTS